MRVGFWVAEVEGGHRFWECLRYSGLSFVKRKLGRVWMRKGLDWDFGVENMVFKSMKMGWLKLGKKGRELGVG